MTKVKVVTGFVPIVNHPRTAAEYGKLGERLGELPVHIHPFYQRVEDTWLWKFVSTLPFRVTHAEADNPLKNTLAYHCVQHQKFQWLIDAMEQDSDSDVFVWIDYGIYSVPGLEREPIVEFLARVKRNDLAIPGCWSKFDNRVIHPNDDQPNWRFCGGVMVVDRRDIPMLYNAVKLMACQRIMQTHKATFEVNTLARVDMQGVMNIRWYKADHDNSLFTGY